MKRLLFILAALFATAQAQTIQTIGAPTTTVVSRGNFRTDSIFYLPKRTKLPTDSGAVRYQISDSSVYYWTGAQWRRLGVHIDTGAMLLPYLRKVDTTAMLSPYLKESDTVFLSNRINLKLNSTDTASLSNRINLKVNISDTSTMLGNYIRHAGNGLIKSGQALSVDTAAIATRARVQKGIDSVASIASGNISGTLTTNYLPKATGTSSIGNSVAYDNGGEILLNTTSDVGDYKLQSNGNVYVKGKIDISANDPSGLNVYRLTSSEVYAQVFNTTGWAYMGADRSTGGGLVPSSQPNAAIFASGYVAPIQFAIDTTIRATIDTFGNVGIGVLPTERLHVNGRIRAATIDSVTSPFNLLTANASGVIQKTRVTSGTVTSVATGTGLSGGTITTTGTISADTAILATRLRVGKVVDSLALVKQNVLTNPVTGTGTTNYVPKFTGTSTIGNSSIFDDGEVKINTTGDAGDYNLQVSGNTYISGQTALSLVSGNVGVGRVPSNWNGSSIKALQVLGGALYGFPSSELGLLSNAFFDAGTFKYVYTGAAAYYVQVAGNHQWLSAGSGSAGGSITFSESMRINTANELLIGSTSDKGDYKFQNTGNAYITGTSILAATSGNVGIGTESPNVYGAGSTSKYLSIVNTTSSVHSVLELIGGSGGTGIIHFGTAAIRQGQISSVDGSHLSFRVNSTNSGTSLTERIRLQNDGKLGIGIIPTKELNLYKTGDSVHAFLQSDSDQEAGIFIKNLSNYIYVKTTDTYGLTFNVQSGDRMQVTQTGLEVIGGSIKSGAPTDGTAAPWKLGSYVTTAPTATGYVQVEINGVKYKLLAATY